MFKIINFIKIDNENSAIESIIDKDTDLIVKQNQKIIFKSQLKVIKDEPPEVDFFEDPKSTIKGVMDIDYIFSDDYDVTKLSAKIVLIKPIEFFLKSFYSRYRKLLDLIKYLK